MNEDIQDMSDDEEINTTCSTLLCVERVEQILMTLGYSYNEKYKLFERLEKRLTECLDTVCIDQKSNKSFYLLIDKRLDIKTVSKEKQPSKILIQYLGHIPDTEIDFNILLNLLSIKNNNEDYFDKNYFDNIINNFKKILIMSGYTFNKSNGKFFKEIISYSKMPVFLSIFLDTRNDILQISEEYSQFNLLKENITNIQDHESILTLYRGKIPKTKFEFHTISNLIDLYIN